MIAMPTSTPSDAAFSIDQAEITAAPLFIDVGSDDQKHTRA
jgi:hypothetical protein